MDFSNPNIVTPSEMYVKAVEAMHKSEHHEREVVRGRERLLAKAQRETPILKTDSANSYKHRTEAIANGWAKSDQMIKENIAGNQWQLARATMYAAMATMALQMERLPVPQPPLHWEP